MAAKTIVEAILIDPNHDYYCPGNPDPHEGPWHIASHARLVCVNCHVRVTPSFNGVGRWAAKNVFIIREELSLEDVLT